MYQKQINNLISKFTLNEIKLRTSQSNYYSDILNWLFSYNKGLHKKIFIELANIYDIDISHLTNRPSSIKKLKVEERICPICSTKFKENENAKRICCSRTCSNLYFKNRYKKETRICEQCGNSFIKRSDSIKKICDTCENENHKIFSKTCKCALCGISIRKTKSGLCKKCLPKDLNYRLLISKKIQERVANGTHHGWSTRYKLKPSYPEQYFINYFNSIGLEFEREVKIGKYFADFLFENKIVLEIDGGQHKYSDRLNRDKEKDEFLINSGYRVYRIDWFNPVNDTNRNKLYSQTQTFLSDACLLR